MVKVYAVTDEDGTQLDARFEVDGCDVVFHSRGGTKGLGGKNTEYSKALLLVLKRLSISPVSIKGALVDSTTVQSLSPEARTILRESEASEPPEQIHKLMTGRMKEVRSNPASEAKGGNSTKRIRIATSFQGSSEDLAHLLGGTSLDGDFRSQERLPAEILNLASPEYIWQAVQQFLAGPVTHSFGPSTDFDLIADDGRRLPPKAVFGVALSLALGRPITPKHFSAGERSTCFRLLLAAGYIVVPKDSVVEAQGTESEPDDGQEWQEGRKRLVSHQMRERGTGLSRAKKAQYRRLHGKLKCERCGLDPVTHFGTVHAEACIEVHHEATHVSEMSENHKTTLDDLKCLCANCHRLVHRLLAQGAT